MTDFVRELEAELLAAARRRAARRHRWATARPPALLAAGVVTAALAAIALLPIGGHAPDDAAPSRPAPCSAQELLRESSCTSNPFAALRQ